MSNCKNLAASWRLPSFFSACADKVCTTDVTEVLLAWNSADLVAGILLAELLKRVKVDEASLPCDQDAIGKPAPLTDYDCLDWTDQHHDLEAPGQYPADFHEPRALWEHSPRQERFVKETLQRPKVPG